MRPLSDDISHFAVKIKDDERVFNEFLRQHTFCDANRTILRKSSRETLKK